LVPAGEDIQNHRPLGISCAAAFASDKDEPYVWFHGMGSGYPQAGAMTTEENLLMLENLEAFVAEGYTIVTWNGNFDWDILAEETGHYKLCSRLALYHIDMMYHFLCIKGYPLGLDAACKGSGLPGKTDMTGALAPEMWAKDLGGRYKTLGYVVDDARNTLQLYQRTTERRSLPWTSKSGKANTLYLDFGWQAVLDAMREPLPDTSWMTTPMPRENFYAWVDEEVSDAAKLS
jgi:hypothetical protein